MKPIIGILTRPGISESGYYTMGVYKSIIDIVIKNGGIPIALIPPITNDLYRLDNSNTPEMSSLELEDFNTTLSMCNGFICGGGDNYYDYDLKLIKYAYRYNKPLLGICLGMQTMACALNGQLEDIKNNIHYSPKLKYSHFVNLEKTSMIYQILKETTIRVNSRHKSKVVNTDLKITGLSNDGTIEAIEDSNKKFFIGVQWHPENMTEYDIVANRLFAYFIDCCRG